MIEQGSRVLYYALVFDGEQIGQWTWFKTEAEIDEFGRSTSSYDAKIVLSTPDRYEKHDPPVVFAVIADKDIVSLLESNKITAPYAVYVRGQKWICSLPEGVNPVALWSAK